MSATASTAPEPGASVPLFTPWVLLATVCCALMWLSPGNETIPYHVAWAGFALAYGFDTWSPTRTVVALGSYTLATGGLLVTRAAQDVLAWQELAEIPLMLLLMFGVFYFVLWRPQSKERKKTESFRQNLKKGDRVRTQGGIIGTITQVEDAAVHLDIGAGDDPVTHGDGAGVG